MSFFWPLLPEIMDILTPHIIVRRCVTLPCNVLCNDLNLPASEGHFQEGNKEFMRDVGKFTSYEATWSVTSFMDSRHTMIYLWDLEFSPSNTAINKQNGFSPYLELVSSLARVRNSRSSFQSNFCNKFLAGI